MIVGLNAITTDLVLLSIIIPTRNRYAMLSRCLATLRPQAQGLGAEVYEIIVSDDSPGDEQKGKLAVDFPNVHWNRGPQQGPAANRNNGAKVAKGDWLIFVDDDCIPEPTLLTAYIKAISENPDFFVFEGAILPKGPQMRMDDEAPLNEGGGRLWSCNFMIRRELFVKLNGFCELFPYAALEDVDLRERLKIGGYPFMFVSKAGVVHPWRLLDSAGKHFKTQLISHRIFYARYPELRISAVRMIYGLIRTSFSEFFTLGPRVYFRGFGRWFVRKWTNGLLVLVLATKPAEPPPTR